MGRPIRRAKCRKTLLQVTARPPRTGPVPCNRRAEVVDHPQRTRYLAQGRAVRRRPGARPWTAAAASSIHAATGPPRGWRASQRHRTPQQHMHPPAGPTAPTPEPCPPRASGRAPASSTTLSRSSARPRGQIRIRTRATRPGTTGQQLGMVAPDRPGTGRARHRRAQSGGQPPAPPRRLGVPDRLQPANPCWQTNPAPAPCQPISHPGAVPPHTPACSSPVEQRVVSGTTTRPRIRATTEGVRRSRSARSIPPETPRQRVDASHCPLNQKGPQQQHAALPSALAPAPARVR